MKSLSTVPLVLLLAVTGPAVCRAEDPAIDQISMIAANSDCAKYDWKDRGPSKAAYPKGMAIVFAKALCQPDRGDVRVVSSAINKNAPNAERKDALVWYDPEYASLGMKNDKSGADTLRHAYTLLMGLGMRESSGKLCVGRDASANFTSADSAEAGLFQTSWGARIADDAMEALFHAYEKDSSKCLLDVFSKNVSCSKWDAKTWGDGNGAAWQKLTKACPAFATEYAAVLLRTSAGKKGEFGPIRTKKTELLAICDSMFQRVQDLIKEKPALCDQLK